MTEQTFFRRSLYFTGIITVGIWSLLLWSHYHGGVTVHHILHREDLPGISNWWGGLLLPLLTLLLTHRMQKRIFRNKDSQSSVLPFPMEYAYRFLFALSFGVLLSVFFTLGHSNLSGYIVNGLFFLALFFPIYRAECLLGFVIGMTFTFGAVLPTGVGIIFASIGAVLYLYVRGGILYLVKKIRPGQEKA